MRDTIQNLKNEALAQILEAENMDDLEQLRIDYLGRNGKLTKQIKEIKELRGSERKKAGLVINEAKQTIQSALADLRNDLKSSVREWYDPTIPGQKPNIGHLHPMTRAIREITDIFKQIGFVRVRYPEVDWDWYAFEALNMPAGHPARDVWETFFVDKPMHHKWGKMVLTPHTSNGQVREMERVKSTPPIRLLNIAKCYRRQSDASHTTMFHQFEGLVVDRGINVSHLKGTLEYFVKKFYGPKIKIRFRPHNFSFTEPSFEIDTSCTFCEGKKCKLCRHNGGWLEQTGGGMVHPNVLKAGGIDPKIYSGFAWGWGVERAYMVKPGLKIPDIRVLYSTDLRNLKQL